ncbi:MAG: YkvA family protein [Patescibacteria group bacterium]
MSNKTKKFLRKNWTLVLAIVYLLSPIDFIPDVLPVFGFSDDILLLIATLIYRYIKFRDAKNDEVIEGEIVNDE